jgi:RNA polymerase sigma-70 factor (ECF subfamily)
VALSLKLVGGFGVGEIARAFLADERAVAQRLVRAKRALRDADATFEMPEGDALVARLDAVQVVLYLMFNEGHTAHAGEALLRRDLSDEALRLAERLLRDPRTASPAVHALAALFCFHSSRFDARLDADGSPVRLADQDRTRWDAARIARGFTHLEAAAAGDRLTPYHLEAEIASLHAMAPSLEATDWPRIVGAYDRLLALAPSPVIALNRIVAVQRAVGAERAWTELRTLARDPALAAYPLTHAVRGTLLAALDRPEEAREAWEEARARSTSQPMQRHAEQRLAELDALVLARDVDSGDPHPS